MPPRHMCLVDRHLSFTEGDRDYTDDLLLFHVTQMRYIAVQVQVRRFDPALVTRARYALDLVHDLVRVPAVHAPAVGVLLCTDPPPISSLAPSPTLYDGLTPDEQAELPLSLEFAALATAASTLPPSSPRRPDHELTSAAVQVLHEPRPRFEDLQAAR